MYEFSGNQLIVKPSSPDEHWRVAWERYWPGDLVRGTNDEETHAWEERS
jgi:hypothetical protein